MKALSQSMKSLSQFPDDWPLVPLGDVITEFRGGAPLRPSDFTRIGMKVLPKGGVGRTGWLYIEDADLQYCSVEYAKKHYRNQVDETFTIVVLRDLVPSGPSIGLMVRINAPETFVLAQGVYGLKVNLRADPAYLVHLSNTHWYRQLANSIMVGSTQVHITNTAFKQVEIPLPSVPEQRAIATALSDVDALIASLDKLIAKKRAIKTATMQQLLTGKKRLPGFCGEWSTISIAKHATLKARIGWQALTTEEYLDSGRFYLVTGTDFFNGRVNWETCHFVDEWRYNQDKNIQLTNDDVLLTKDGTIGKVGYVENLNGPATLNSGVFVIRPMDKSFTPMFLFYILTSKIFDEFLGKITAGSTITHLYQKDFITFDFLAPEIQEQTAIATVLSDMDAEITALEARRDKTKAIKQGMMQELLTGRTRLI